MWNYIYLQYETLKRLISKSSNGIPSNPQIIKIALLSATIPPLYTYSPRLYTRVHIPVDIKSRQLVAVSTYVRASTREKEGVACTRIESREERGGRRRLVRKRHFLTSIAAGMQPVPWSTPGFECPRSSPLLALSTPRCSVIRGLPCAV